MWPPRGPRSVRSHRRLRFLGDRREGGSGSVVRLSHDEDSLATSGSQGTALVWSKLDEAFYGCASCTEIKSCAAQLTAQVLLHDYRNMHVNIDMSCVPQIFTSMFVHWVADEKRSTRMERSENQTGLPEVSHPYRAPPSAW